MAKKATLHVCVSCRINRDEANESRVRDGTKLYKQLVMDVVSNGVADKIELNPTKCLSLCKHACGIAFSCDNYWHYLLGNQHKDNTADIFKFADLYLNSEGGVVAKEDRPESIQNSVLGRIPPITK